MLTMNSYAATYHVTNNSDPVPAAPNDGSFRGALLAAANSTNPDIIVFDATYSITLSNTQLDNITEELIIQGNNSTIDANNQFVILRLFTNVEVNNLNFINGNSSSSGGAIFINMDATNTISFNNCNFNNNHSDQNGGAIYVNDSDGDLEVEQCEFDNNSSSRGGAISASNKVLVNNSEFENNSANSGGALYQGGLNLTISNSIINQNSGGNSAAIFCFGQSVTINDCTISNNGLSGAVRLNGSATQGLITGTCNFSPDQDIIINASSTSCVQFGPDFQNTGTVLEVRLL